MDSESLHSPLRYKRLEKGHFTWPVTKEGTVTLTPAQLSMLLEGLEWRAPRQTWAPTLAG